MKKINLKKYKFEIIVFSLFLIIGILTFKHYGLSNDEEIQRVHSLINYEEYYNFFHNFGHNKYIKVHTKILPSYILNMGINNYPYKYYGVGLQLPMVFIEHLFFFKLSDQTVFYMRHFFSFILFFIATIYFYLLISKYIIKDKKYALLGTIFLILSPRIYGESFYNIKDGAFLSLFIINCYYICKFIECDKLKLRDVFKLSIITALTINSRIVGAIAIFIGFIIKLILNKNKLKSVLIEIGKVLLVSIVIYILMTPASWKNPIIYFIDCIRFFFNYKDPNSDGMQYCFYFGKWIKANSLPFHYIPVWIFITTPLLYIILFIVGCCGNIRKIIKTKLKSINIYILYLNIIFFIMIIFCMVVRPTLYGGWRHLHFIYPILIVNSVVGLKYILINFIKYKKVIYTLIIINSICLIIWMIKSHPYQNEYFHFPVRKYKYDNFETNYSRLSTAEALKYIVKIDKHSNINVLASYNNDAYRILTPKAAERLTLYYIRVKNPDYVIDGNSHGNIELEKKKNCKIVKIKYFENIRLYTIYKCKNMNGSFSVRIS